MFYKANPFFDWFSASAFRRLPEGQIESLWDVFAVQLRDGWSSGGGSGGELLAREVDAELFVLLVRNLHVTSSVASGVGKLCTGLAEEVGHVLYFVFLFAKCCFRQV